MKRPFREWVLVTIPPVLVFIVVFVLADYVLFPHNPGLRFEGEIVALIAGIGVGLLLRRAIPPPKR